MAKVYSEDFKREAVRIALTSGLPRKEVAADLGVGKSSLCAWISAYGREETGTPPEGDMLQEPERLRKENRIRKEEREVLKKDETFVRHWSEDNGRMPSLRRKGNEVRIYCSISWRSDTSRTVPFVAG